MNTRLSRNMMTGRIGENLAARYLQMNGYKIVSRNYRFHRFEIDIIALKASTLHFIEVKTARSVTYGFPEARVTDQKVRHMMEAVNGYLQNRTETGPIQLDIVSIQLSGKTPDFFLIEDIYSIPSAPLIRTPHPKNTILLRRK